MKDESKPKTEASAYTRVKKARDKAKEELEVTRKFSAIKDKKIKKLEEELEYFRGLNEVGDSAQLVGEIENITLTLDALAKTYCKTVSNNHDSLLSIENLQASEFWELINRYKIQGDVDSLYKISIGLFLLLSQSKNDVFVKNKMLERISNREIKVKRELKELEMNLMIKNAI